ncbi:DUF721 domain-containing protein [Desulfohalovibrio reitneri]|uniref:DUF721 domain-containing protein n=1 Tax=Desulfohalovibrio reitneri TaxID=1307759 RepID=UPI0004A758FC|nr:DUF721 domain-containing protein [Desulfohalovibrio reitneri]
MTWRKRTRDNSEGRAAAAGDEVRSLLERMGGSERTDAVRLWRSWREVLGDELADMVRPLGIRGRTLVLGAEGPMVMQELSFLAPDIVTKCNVFLGRELFDKATFELLHDRVPLDVERAASPQKARPAPRPPENLGGLERLKESDDPVGRSYRAYLRRFGKI